MTNLRSITADTQRILETLRQIEENPLEMLDSAELLSVISESLRSTVQNVRVLTIAGHLFDLARQLCSELDTTKMLEQILKAGLAFLPADVVSVGLLHGSVIRFRVSRGQSLLPDNYYLELNKGLSGLAIRQQRPVKADNVKDQQWKEIYETQDPMTLSELDVPLMFEDRVLGVLNAEGYRLNAFDDLDEEFLVVLASFTAFYLHYTRAAVVQKSLLEAAQKLQASTNFEQLLRDVLRSSMDLVGATHASIGLIEGENIKFKYTLGPHAESVERFVVAIGRGLVGEAVAQKRILREEDVRMARNYVAQISDTRSEMDVPIIFGDQVIGVLNFESPNISEFAESEEDIAVSFANIASVAIQNLKTHQERLNAASEMALIGDVTTGLLHDVNNQVSLLRAFSFDIQKSDSAQEREDLAQRIRKTSDELLDRTADFSNRYRIDNSEGTSVNLYQVIQDALKNVPQPDNVQVDLQSVLGTINVRAHAEQLREVIRNLIRNSIEAMPNGGKITLTVDQEDQFAVLFVKDQGVGIPRDLWDRVFARDYSTKRTVRGMKSGGIGLWWCNLYMARIGGKIKIADSTDSGPKRGTTFRLEMPLEESEV
jgi:signal transduction histidine kinase